LVQISHQAHRRALIEILLELLGKRDALNLEPFKRKPVLRHRERKRVLQGCRKLRLARGHIDKTHFSAAEKGAKRGQDQRTELTFQVLNRVKLASAAQG